MFSLSYAHQGCIFLMENWLENIEIHIKYGEIPSLNIFNIFNKCFW